MTTMVACNKCTHATGFIERPRMHACFSVFPNLIVITLRPSTQSFSSSVGAARHEVLTPPKYHGRPNARVLCPEQKVAAKTLPGVTSTRSWIGRRRRRGRAAQAAQGAPLTRFPPLNSTDAKSYSRRVDKYSTNVRNLWLIVTNQILPCRLAGLGFFVDTFPIPQKVQSALVDFPCRVRWIA